MARAYLQRVRSPRRRGLIAATAKEEIKRGMDRDVKPALIKELDAVVSDWDGRPEFRGRLVVKMDRITLYVFPWGEHKMKFVYVDRGTKPHKIPKVPGKRLAFEVPTEAGARYVPKTLARPARTVPGGGFVPKPKTLVRPIQVDHPGSEGRDFTGQIAKKQRPKIKASVDAAFKRAARRINAG